MCFIVCFLCCSYVFVFSPKNCYILHYFKGRNFRGNKLSRQFNPDFRESFFRKTRWSWSTAKVYSREISNLSKNAKVYSREKNLKINFVLIFTLQMYSILSDNPACRKKVHPFNNSHLTSQNMFKNNPTSLIKPHV